MNIYLIIGIVIWLYSLSILKRAHLSAFHFIVGSGGLFFILMAISDPYWVWFFTHAVINGVKVITNPFKICAVMSQYGMVNIFNTLAPVNMSIDYECSGIIETAAFVSLVVFLPLYNRHERLFFSLLGMVWIYVANIIRLLVVIVIVHFGGGPVFFLAHSIIGRIVFYVLVIILYYEVFTYSQLSRSLYRSFKGKVRQINVKIKRKQH